MIPEYLNAALEKAKYGIIKDETNGWKNKGYEEFIALKTSISQSRKEKPSASWARTAAEKALSLK